jgi:hypothetical protein
MTKQNSKINFLGLSENSEIKRQPIGNQGNNKNKDSSSGKKLERGCQLPRNDAKEQV